MKHPWRGRRPPEKKAVLEYYYLKVAVRISAPWFGKGGLTIREEGPGTFRKWHFHHISNVISGNL